MFSELPGFFDRNFIVAYFLPSLLFVLSAYWLMGEFGVEPKLVKIIGDDLYKEATLLGIISLIAAVFLLSINFQVFRFFEGYGKYNPLIFLQGFHERKFQRLEEKKYLLNEELRIARLAGDDDEIDRINARRIHYFSYAADNYPPKRSRLLPTAFGNAVRAFEEYSETMYGLDSIVSWVRLLAMIPKDFREMMNSVRAELDMWMNFRLLSYVLFVSYIILAVGTGQWKAVWFLPVIALFARIAAKRLTVSAIHYGDFVKSSYDLYLPDLRDQIRLPETETIEEEKNLWKKFTRQVTYHNPEQVLQRISKDKKKDKTESEE